MASSLRVSFILAGLLVLVPIMGGSFLGYQIALFLIYAIAVQGVGYLWSKTGILPLGQASFFGLGAYLGAGSLLWTDSYILQLILLLSIVLAIALIGFVMSVIIFRGRSETGPYFSLITLALTMLAEQTANNARSLTGGFNGLGGFQPLFGLDPFEHLYWLVAASLILVTYFLLWLDERPAGIVTAAVADNEPRLQLLGYPTHIIKAIIFALSAGLAGFAGVLFASHQGLVTPTAIGFLLSAELVIWAAVGGRFHPLGAILGAVVIGMFSVEFRDVFEFWEVALAAIFLFVVLITPRGMWGLLERWIGKIVTFHQKGMPIEKAKPIKRHRVQSGVNFQEVGLQIGNVSILDDVSFDTKADGILAVIGPNGAGKTSLLSVMTGKVRVSTGQIFYDNHYIENRPSFMGLKSGIGCKLQVPSIFHSMSVADNITISMMCARAKLLDYFSIRSRHWRSEWFCYLAEQQQFEFLQNSSELAGHLPQGHRQFLEFLMVSLSEPSLLLLDEPGAGLSPEETKAMSRLIQEYSRKYSGLIILIEHDMSIVADISDRVVVMHQGRVLAQGSYLEIKRNEQVSAVYLGGSKA